MANSFFKQLKSNVVKSLKTIRGEHIFLGILVLTLVLSHTPGLFEPHWHPQEGLYAGVAKAVRNGSILYKEIWSDNLPGIHGIFYLSQQIHPTSLVIVRILNLIFSIVSLTLIYTIAKKIQNIHIARFSSVAGLLLLSIPIFETNIAHPEIFAITFTLIGFWYVVKNSKLSFFIAGCSLGLAALFSPSGIFFVIGITLYLSCTQKNRKLIALFLLSFLMIVLPVIGYFHIHTALPDIYRSVFKEKFQLITPFASSKLGFVILPNILFVRVIMFFTAYFIVRMLYKRKRISKKAFLIILWSMISIFSLLFHEQNASRYLITTIPILSICTGIIITCLLSSKSIEQKLHVLGTYIVSLSLVLHIFTSGAPLIYERSVIAYYSNSYKYITGKIDATSYTKSFGKETYTTYRLNLLLSQRYPDTHNIYVWTENPWIYTLADIEINNKYLSATQAAEHIGEVKSQITKDTPEVIVVDSNATNPKLLESYIQEQQYEIDITFETYTIFVKSEFAQRI